MAVEMVDDRNYKSFIEGTSAVLVFGVSFCRHCQRYAPVVKALSKELQDVKFGWTEVDSPRPFSLVLERFAPVVSSGRYPTTAVLREGQSPVYFSGAYHLDDCRAIIQDILSAGDALPESFIAKIQTIDPQAQISAVERQAILDNLRMLRAIGVEQAPPPNKMIKVLKNFLRL